MIIIAHPSSHIFHVGSALYLKPALIGSFLKKHMVGKVHIFLCFPEPIATDTGVISDQHNLPALLYLACCLLLIELMLNVLSSGVCAL